MAEFPFVRIGEGLCGLGWISMVLRFLEGIQKERGDRFPGLPMSYIVTGSISAPDNQSPLSFPFPMRK